MPDNCTNCGTTTVTPCVDCDALLQTIHYCDDGCADLVSTDCIQYGGSANITLNNGTTVYPLEQLTTILQKLFNNNTDIALDGSFNPQNRILTIKKNGATAISVTIPDGDDQYLDLQGSKLQIWRGGNTPLKINEVDLSTLFTETTFAAQSSSLVIVSGGVKGHNPQIELIPSTDTGNALVNGSDGKPYVPTPDFGVGDVIMHDTPGISWTRVVTNGVIHYTPVIDWQYVANQVCPMCNPSCGAPSELTIS